MPVKHFGFPGVARHQTVTVWMWFDECFFNVCVLAPVVVNQGLLHGLKVTFEKRKKTRVTQGKVNQGLLL